MAGFKAKLSEFLLVLIISKLQIKSGSAKIKLKNYELKIRTASK